MIVRRGLAALVLVSVFFAYSTIDLQAADKHVVSQEQLHQAVLYSDHQISLERKAVQDFIDRPEVQAQFKAMRLSPEKLKAAMLSDKEIQTIHQQIMTWDAQKNTAGLSKGAIVAIVLGGVAILALVIYLAVRAVDETVDDYDYYY
jgi:hypothetical protein